MAKQEVFKSYINPIFIETGSFYGDGVHHAVEAGFRRVISIEVAKAMYDICIDRFKDDDNVELYLGDSLDLLPIILKTVDEPCTFWLDAHPADKPSGKGRKAVPLMEELGYIKQHIEKTGLKHTILVDDMKYFRQSKGWNGVYKDKIIAIIKQMGDYEISYADGTVKDDILIATL